MVKWHTRTLQKRMGKPVEVQLLSAALDIKSSKCYYYKYMNTNLVRTTTYFDPTLLNLAKKHAIDEGKSLYEIINEALQKLLNQQQTIIQVKTATFENIKTFPTYKLGLKKKVLKRSDAYDL